MPRRPPPAEEHTTIHEETAGAHTEAPQQAPDEHAETQTTPIGQGVATEQEQPEAAVLPLKIDVRISNIRNAFGNSTRATATVTLNDAFVINGFRVVMGENGLFCAMPARRIKEEYVEVCHPVTADFSHTLQASVLAEYRIFLAQQMQESQQVPDVYELLLQHDELPFEPGM